MQLPADWTYQPSSVRDDRTRIAHTRCAFVTGMEFDTADAHDRQVMQRVIDMHGTRSGSACR